jgi:hypothetical protein
MQLYVLSDMYFSSLVCTASRVSISEMILAEIRQFMRDTIQSSIL